LAQRMIVMNAGVMEQFGTPEEVYHRPASTFVASFIGSPPMNLLMNAPGGRPRTIMGIRPEHLDVGTTGWEVQVETTELLIVRTGEDEPVHTPGSTIHVKPREDRVHWFDGASHKRI